MSSEGVAAEAVLEELSRQLSRANIDLAIMTVRARAAESRAAVAEAELREVNTQREDQAPAVKPQDLDAGEVVHGTTETELGRPPEQPEQ